MKTFTPPRRAGLLALLATSLLAGGCSGPSNNTQRGAAGGAALGALAGAVIGNNRGSGNAASGAAIGAAAGAIAGGAIGHSRDQREAAVSSSNSAQQVAETNIYVDGPPPIAPAPQAEAIPPKPTSDAIWVPGYWSYENGQNYAWVAGHWEIPPAGYSTFVPPQWRRQGSGNVYVRGYWR